MADKARRGEARGVERRFYSCKFETRASANGDGFRTLSGYASVFDTPYQMYDWAGPYDEVMRSGAFTKTLSETPQTQLLLNHGGLSMAYTRAGSLRLAEDSTGLAIEADVNMARSDVRDMVTAIDDGDIDEMSFAFRCVRQMWSPDYEQRDILEADIHRGDVSVVNFGANPATTVDAVRAQDFDRLSDDAARELYERLGRRLAPDPEEMPLSLAVALAAAQG